MIPPITLLTVKNLLRVLPYILAALLVWYVIHQVRVADFDRGAASVQQKWDTEQQAHNNNITSLKVQLAALEADHKIKTAEISNELAEANKNHLIVVNRLVADYQHRLLLSTKRADIYKRQAEGGTVECGNLASHAGRLDSTLEEGRSLVAELRTTLELRDRQVKGLGDQILNDRTLFTK